MLSNRHVTESLHVHVILRRCVFPQVTGWPIAQLEEMHACLWQVLHKARRMYDRSGLPMLLRESAQGLLHAHQHRTM
jgi:hypothetical protein